MFDVLVVGWEAREGDMIFGTTKGEKTKRSSSRMTMRMVGGPQVLIGACTFETSTLQEIVISPQFGDYVSLTYP